MRLIIEARMEDEQTSSTATEATIVAAVERQERSIAGLGLTLAEGRALLAQVQSVLVSHQSAGCMADQQTCCRCGSMLAHKDSRSVAALLNLQRTRLSAIAWRISNKCGGPTRERTAWRRSCPQR